jgi:hypothetical protein
MLLLLVDPPLVPPQRFHDVLHCWSECRTPVHIIQVPISVNSLSLALSLQSKPSSEFEWIG